MKSIQAGRQNKRQIVYHGWRRALYSWPAIILILALVGLFGRSVWRVYGDWQESRDLARVAKERHDLEQAELLELRTMVAKQKTARGREEELRKNFPIALPGEEVVIILEDQATSSN